MYLCVCLFYPSPQLDRVRFVLSSYLRTRFQKVSIHDIPTLVCLSLISLHVSQIERHVMHVLEQEADPNSPSHLSPEELAFAKE